MIVAGLPPLATVDIDRTFYRIGRGPDPLTPTRGSTSGDTRLADPLGEFEVLYLSSSPYGAAVEALQWFRPDMRVARDLAGLYGRGDPITWIGTVPAQWFAPRVLAATRIVGRFAELGHSETLAHLRVALADTWLSSGFEDLDAATIRLADPRTVTQAASRYVREHANGFGTPLAGIVYRSRFGDEIMNVALHGPPKLDAESLVALDPHSPAVVKACSIHRLKVGDL